jgi:hypothetical protein
MDAIKAAISTCGRQTQNRVLEVANPEQIMCTSPLLRIDLESKGQEVLEDLTERLFILDFWSAIGSDQVQSSERRLGEIRGFALDHLDGHDTEGPDVDLAAVVLAGDDFRSHPVWSTNHGGALGLAVVDLGAETEISCGVGLVGYLWRLQHLSKTY